MQDLQPPCSSRLMQLLPPTMDLNTGVRRSYLSVSVGLSSR
nr:MAG TPA_asm: hypothetical protein [Caudoviricetes sp.]